MTAIDPPDPSSVPNEPKRMLDLLSVGSASTKSGWMPSELGAILAHQLDVPLKEVVADVDIAWRDRTLRTLFSDSSPPVSVLGQLKHVFKVASTTQDDVLPVEVATVLYIAVIVVAQRGGEQLTSLDEASLRSRIEWASRRRWLDPMLAELFKNPGSTPPIA